MQRNIRCAVLGLGRQGYRHAENLANRVSHASLVAVSDVQVQVAKRVAQDLGVEVWTSDAESLLERSDIDAVIVATPTDTHAPLAKLVAASGKHLFLEKPLSLDLAEALDAMKMVMASGVICQLGFMRRFDPAYADLRRRIANGDIGVPLYFKGVSRDPVAPPAAYVAVSGGIFLDQSIHDYDAARFLMGEEISHVTALGSVLFSKEVAQYGDVDQALTYLSFSSGAAGDIEAYRNAFYGYDIRAEVLGTEGMLQISGLQQQQVTLFTEKKGMYDVMPGFLERFADAYLLELNHFIDCIRNQTTPDVGIEDGYRALAVAMAARESLHKQTKIPVHYVVNSVGV